MKMISLLLLLLSSQVFAGLENDLSSKLGASLDTAFSDVPSGKYQIALMASYEYPLAPNGTVMSLPVFLLALKTFQVPEAFQPCQTSPDSLNCLATESFIEWFERQAPPSNGDLIVTAFIFEACQGYPCGLVKQATVSVSVND